MKIFDKLFRIEHDYYLPNWDYIETIPEFTRLKECQQSDKWHKEGNAWEHTKRVVEAAHSLCVDRNWTTNTNNEIYAARLMCSALFHDIGKGVTTFQGKDGRWHSYNHEIKGEKIARRLLWDEGWKFRESICSLVRWHMFPLSIFEKKDFIEEIIRLSKRVPSMNLLLSLKQCDLNGSDQEDNIRKDSDFTKLDEISLICSTMDCLYMPSEINVDKPFLHDELIIREQRPTAQLIVLIGLPGAGKDTSIADFTNKISDDYTVISRDAIREELGYCGKDEKIVGTNEQESKVSEIFKERMLNAAKSGKVIFINNINLKRKYRDSYKAILSNYNLCVTYCYIEAETLGINKKRREGQIPNEAWETMIENFDWPDYSEYDRMFKYTNS